MDRPGAESGLYGFLLVELSASHLPTLIPSGSSSVRMKIRTKSSSQSFVRIKLHNVGKVSGTSCESVPVILLALLSLFYHNNMTGYLILLCLRKEENCKFKNVIMQVRVSHDARTWKVLSKCSLNL